MENAIRKLVLISMLGFGMVFFTGCIDLLETEAAEDIDPELAQENLEGMESLAISLHSRLRAFNRYGNELVLLPDVLTDNTDQHPTTSGRFDSEAINQAGSHMNPWNNGYDVINEANYLIEGVEELDDVSDEVRSRLRGEAYFMRAFAYHDLVRVFAYEPGREVDGWDEGVVIRTEATRDVEDADDRPRSSNQEVYDLVVSDLEQAIDNLSQNDRGDVYYASHEAALALMARVQLYLENWDSAVDYATQAMNETDAGLADADTYANNMFESQPNPESIFELKIDPNTESLGSNNAINAYINPSDWFDVIPSDDLLNAHEEDDVRSQLYVQHIDSDGEPDEFYSTKFNGSAGTHTDHVPIIRYAEMLLIRAEANAELGNETEAVDDLETLRENRGLDSYVTPPSGNDLIAEVLHQSRLEFAFEGRRWFDLKRRGMDIPKQGSLPTIDYEDYRLLAPIPSGEVEDHDVEQNPGY